MKLTQNQFHGRKIMMPREFIPGTSYISTDSQELFIYDESGLPILISSTNTIAPAITWGSIAGLLSSQNDLQNELNLKQDLLVSGTNIKTVNGNSLLEAGDLVIDTGVIPADLISDDANNGIVVGSDGKLYSNTASENTFTLSFPRLAISGNATNVFFASFINTSSVLFNSSTDIADHLSLNTINFLTTRLFTIPQDCIIDKITCSLNVAFELSIWKADSFASPITGKTEVFYEVSSGSGMANYNVASPTLTQGNILVPMIKTLGVTTTYFGDLFITFKTIS